MSIPPTTVPVLYAKSSLEELLENMRYDYAKYAGLRAEMSKNPSEKMLQRAQTYERRARTAFIIVVLLGAIFIGGFAYATILAARRDRISNEASAVLSGMSSLCLFFGFLFTYLAASHRNSAHQYRT